LKIGVLSDTHGMKKATQKVLEYMSETNKEIDTIIHAGDLVSDAKFIERLGYKVYCVAGNCDPIGIAPAERLIEIEGKKIFLAHGHTYQVKYGVNKLLERAKNLSAEIVIFGHTHIPENLKVAGVLLFNPGSVTLPKQGGPGTFGILEIAGKDVFAHHVQVK